LVLVGREGRQRLVLAADRAAQAAGLRVGMEAVRAQALIANLVMKDADLEGDATALDKLALWALRRYSPIVASDPPDGIVIDMTGAAHLVGGEAAMLADLSSRLMKVGLSAHAAMADSWGAAHAVARSIRQQVWLVSTGGSPSALAPLPIARLRLAGETVAGLRRLGFETIAELAATPRAPIALRFGTEVGRRLDQAFGAVVEVITPIRADELVSVRRAFAEPIGAPETLHRYTRKLVEALCSELEAKALGARRLDLLFFRVDNRIEAVRVGMSTPVREVKRLTRLLGHRIETVEPGFGIEIMTLTATVAEPLMPKQRATALVEEEEADVSDLVDLLANRVGSHRVYALHAVSSDVPECSVVMAYPPTAAGTADALAQWPRPSRLITPPEVIEAIAMLPDHPPVAFTWRGIRRWVKRADGPERIFGEWWKCDAELAAVRDYFRVEDEAGERFWIYRAGDGEDAETGSHRWFMHGLFG
jgi:protein ImuB